MRKIQFLAGLVLAIGACIGTFLIGQMTKPPEFPVLIAVKEIPPYSTLDANMVAVDSWGMSPAVAKKYLPPETFKKTKVVTIEPIHVGQPILLAQVVYGQEAEKATRLSTALKDPNLTIVTIPVHQEALPKVTIGDTVGLVYYTGDVQAQTIVTTTKHITPTEVTLALPVTKWLTQGIVYSVNRELKENPYYGAPGMEGQPMYIEGDVKSISVAIPRSDVEKVTFALNSGKIQVVLMSALAKELLETGELSPTIGYTWSDFEKEFFTDRFGGAKHGGD
jgi:hypothetical protein